MYYNQQYQENNLNQQFLGQQDIPIPVNQQNNGSYEQPKYNNINSPFSNPQQVNPQMNIPYTMNSNNIYFPQGYPPNYPPNFIKPEELFDMQ